jgi:glycosyltransferase involved in cell wall biosynthesis
MKPRILICNPSISFFGGAERQIAQLANYLAFHDYPIAIFTTFAIQEFKDNLIQGVRLMEFGNEQALMQATNTYAHKFEIVNPHNHPSELYLAYQLKATKVWQCNEPPTSVLEGKPLAENERVFVERTTKKAVVISDFDWARFRKIYGFTPVVNYPGVRYDFFSAPIKVRNTLNMKGNFVITQIGTFTWTKNQLATVGIFAEVKKQIENAKLVLIGHGFNSPYGAKVWQKIEQLHLEDDVIINDFLEGDASIQNVYKQSSVFINPIIDQGGWATTFEAMCAGVPTIVSEGFPAANLVKNNNLGAVLPIEKFAEGICNVASNLQAEQQKTVENAKWIRDNLTWENFGKKYEEVFEEVLK